MKSSSFTEGSDVVATIPVSGAPEETEVIRSVDLVPEAGALVGAEERPRRQWMLAAGLLTVITVESLILLTATITGDLTTDQAGALAGGLITPLAALLGAAVAFYYRDT